MCVHLIPSVYVVISLNILVNYFLLLGTNRLTGFSGDFYRSIAAAVLGGVYAWICTIPCFSYLTGMFCKVFCLLLLGSVAFGVKASSYQRCVIFAILSLAMDGAVLGFGRNSFLLVALCSIGICSACFLAEGSTPPIKKFYPVIIRTGNQTLRLTALSDTGNCLKDPITGEPVMVVGYSVAKKITGLSQKQLQMPLDTFQSKPNAGFRLIPYTSVGKQRGMLLAIAMQEVEINGRKRKQLVALAPGDLGEFDALLGGFLNA